MSAARLAVGLVAVPRAGGRTCIPARAAAVAAPAPPPPATPASDADDPVPSAGAAVGPARRVVRARRAARPPAVVYGGAGGTWSGLASAPLLGDDDEPLLPQPAAAAAPPPASLPTPPPPLAADDDGEDDAGGGGAVLLSPPPDFVTPLAVEPGESLEAAARRKLRARRQHAVRLVTARMQAAEQSGDGGGEAASRPLLGSAASGGVDGPAVPPLDLQSLRPGELIVHEDLGVCAFQGVRELVNPARPEAGRQPCVFVAFADGLRQLSAATAAKALHRFSAPGAPAPARPVKLSRAEEPGAWRRRRAKAAAAALAAVGGALTAYVDRVCVQRPRCPRVPPALQAAFGRAFPHPLTAGQAAAVNDVLSDMCDRDEPMDRLVVGDVGFGKTEVACAAALAALAAGRQVAVLAPTTVLARQHASLFASRFEPLGFPTASLTRFSGPAARAAASARVASGEVRLVVGTHALLSAAVRFQALGLLIVDEEQRFGVKHKEAIKGLHARLDVLTLSATPIPRTLRLAMAGFRDASSIDTPPPGRRPIATVMAPFDMRQVAGALAAELARGGQAFYVVPRIEAMAAAEAGLRAALPGVRVLVAHGQLRPAELDAAMEAFGSGAADVLLCTTIVEAGLDLPRVNTIVVEDTPLFGLASLYQLRGRVGRSATQAHCLLTWRPGAAHTPEAAARLAAMAECAGLGDGLRLSTRDLAIRGAGSLFGESQSGDGAGVGADLELAALHDALHRVGEARRGAGKEGGLGRKRGGAGRLSPHRSRHRFPGGDSLSHCLTLSLSHSHSHSRCPPNPPCSLRHSTRCPASTLATSCCACRRSPAACPPTWCPPPPRGPRWRRAPRPPAGRGPPRCGRSRGRLSAPPAAHCPARCTPCCAPTSCATTPPPWAWARCPRTRRARLCSAPRLGATRSRLCAPACPPPTRSCSPGSPAA